MKQYISITDENVEIITHYISQRTNDAVIHGALAITVALISQNSKKRARIVKVQSRTVTRVWYLHLLTPKYHKPDGNYHYYHVVCLLTIFRQ